MKFQLPWARFWTKVKINELNFYKRTPVCFPVWLCNPISNMRMKTKDLKPNSSDYGAQHFSCGVWLQPDKVLSRDVLILSLSGMIITFDIIHLYLRAEVNFGWLVGACREPLFGLWFQWELREGRPRQIKPLSERGRRAEGCKTVRCVFSLFSQSTIYE